MTTNTDDYLKNHALRFNLERIKSGYEAVEKYIQKYDDDIKNIKLDSFGKFKTLNDDSIDVPLETLTKLCVSIKYDEIDIQSFIFNNYLSNIKANSQDYILLEEFLLYFDDDKIDVFIFIKKLKENYNLNINYRELQSNLNEINLTNISNKINQHKRDLEALKKQKEIVESYKDKINSLRQNNRKVLEKLESVFNLVGLNSYATEQVEISKKSSYRKKYETVKVNWKSSLDEVITKNFINFSCVDSNSIDNYINSCNKLLKILEFLISENGISKLIKFCQKQIADENSNKVDKIKFVKYTNWIIKFKLDVDVELIDFSEFDPLSSLIFKKYPFLYVKDLVNKADYNSILSFLSEINSLEFIRFKYYLDLGNSAAAESWFNNYLKDKTDILNMYEQYKGNLKNENEETPF